MLSLPILNLWTLTHPWKSDLVLCDRRAPHRRGGMPLIIKGRGGCLISHYRWLKPLLAPSVTMATMPGEQMSQRRGVKREEAQMDEGQECVCVCTCVAGCLHVATYRSRSTGWPLRACSDNRCLSLNTHTVRIFFGLNDTRGSENTGPVACRSAKSFPFPPVCSDELELRPRTRELFLLNPMHTPLARLGALPPPLSLPPSHIIQTPQMMPDMTAGLNSDQCFPAQLNIKASNERAKKMASLSNMATSWRAREKKGHLSHLYLHSPIVFCLVNSTPNCMHWSSLLPRFASGCADYWGDKGRRGDRWWLWLSDEKITKAKSSLWRKKKKKLSVGKRRTHTRLSVPRTIRNPLRALQSWTIPTPPFPPVVGEAQNIPATPWLLGFYFINIRTSGV